jgi:hypothetical protein
MNTDLTNTLANWESVNRVNDLRSGLTALGKRNPAAVSFLDMIRTQLSNKLDSMHMDPCGQLQSWFRNPMSHLAQNDSETFNRLAQGLPPPAALTPDEIQANTERAETALKASDALFEKTSHAILGNELKQSTEYGYNGMVIYVFHPIILFKNGDVLGAPGAISDPEGLLSNKAHYPKNWGHWRKNQGHYEYTYSDKDENWSHFDNDGVDEASTDSLKLEGHYQHFGGGLPMGGTVSTAWSDFIFHRDGTFETGGGASVTAETSSARTFASEQKVGRHGHYEIRGQVLKATFDDGDQKLFSLIGGQNNMSTVWINGVSYSK